MSSFNLIDEPWIMVQRRSGPATVSVREAFREASDIKRLTGEVPTQAFANLRVLLAIAQHALGLHDKVRLEDVRLDGLDVAAIDSYLDQWHGRFDLFHPERPFMQVAGLRTARGEASGLEKIIADVPNGVPFFTTRSGVAIASISAAEAARWLVHTQAFDPSGIRSGAVGDPLVKGGKGYPIGPSWAGQLGGVVIHGDSLAETLRLNLVQTPNHPDDVPVWALPEAHTALREDEAPVPPGPISLLVWQSRRMRLVGDQRGVTGVVLCQGDRMTPQNRHWLEPMSLWRHSEPQSKKLGLKTYMPNKHSGDRSLWRTLPAALAETAQGDERYLVAATMLGLEEWPELDGTYEVQAIGITYGGNEATIEEIVSDSVDLRASLLRRESGVVRAMLADAVSVTEDAVRALGGFAANVAKSGGERGDGAGEGARAHALQQTWSELDEPARTWISTLDGTTDPVAAQRDWQAKVAELLERQADRLHRSASPASVRGRWIRAGMKDHYVTADVARRWFDGQLRKALPMAFEEGSQHD